MPITHEPPGYACPFCALAGGVLNGVNVPGDIVARTPAAMAFVAARWWPNNPGHVLVVPTVHHENLYDLPAAVGHAVHDLSRTIAVAMRAAYPCDGISVRQNNEPTGSQTVWHYHVHVLPRHPDDNLYRSPPADRWTTAADRLPYAEKLRKALSGTPDAGPSE
jgi:histidine triad (HIT) family protein